MSIHTIVVGVDGSPASHAALRLAIDESTARGETRVKIVTCWSDDVHQLARQADGGDGDSYLTAVAVADEAVDTVAASEHERSLIVVECGEGAPGPALVDLSRGATFLVVGSTTRLALARELGRTTVDHCLHHSEVPVIVVPCTAPDPTAVTVDLEQHRSSAP